MNNPPKPIDPDDVRRACEQYREAMFQRCLGIIGNRADAEDVTNQAVVKVLQNPPTTVDKDLQSWLCGVVKNCAVDFLRKKKVRLRAIPVTAVSPDQFREFQVRADTDRLLEQIREFLGESELRDLPLYLQVARGELTERELADRLGVELAALKERRRRVREPARDAAIAICLIADPGNGATRCDVPQRLARDGFSPLLLKQVRKHLKGCAICDSKRKDTQTLLGKYLAIPGVALGGGLLDRLSRAASSKPVTATAATVLVAVVIAVGLFRADPSLDRSPPEVVPPVRQPGAQVAVLDTPGPIPTRPPTRPRTTGAPPVVPQPVPPARPRMSPPATTTTSPHDGARDDRPPSITGTWLEHRRIAVEGRRDCGDRPTTSTVGVTVDAPGGVESVTLRLRVDGETRTIPMAGAGRVWHGEVGPFRDSGKVEVSVEAVAVNGGRDRERVGTVCVTSCHRSRPESRQ